MDIGEALNWLEAHTSLEGRNPSRAEAPSLEPMKELASLLGDPQRTAPVIHVTGTNGKGSTTRMIASLLMTSGLTVGTFTSPDLERINERVAFNLEPIPDAEFAEALTAVANLELLMTQSISRFDILTGAALRWFSDRPVDVMVLEVGMGGRFDDTNVADAQVAVVTNVALDHAEIIGPTVVDIAREKAGIVKAGSTLVLGEPDVELANVFEQQARDVGAEAVWRRPEDFDCLESRLAHGGRVLDLRTPAAVYNDVYLPLHGGYQRENASAALAAVEAFFGQAVDPQVVHDGFASVTVPGRMEVLGRHPLVVLDGAHNPAGASAAADALEEEFSGVASRVLVLGLTAGRDPAEMIEAFDPTSVRLVIACRSPSPKAVSPIEIAAAASAIGLDAEVAGAPADAIARALALAHEDELILISGSLYVVGAARSILRR